MIRTRDVLTVILAGGRGERLSPLTHQRSKPSVPFGGRYRIIDFTLTNAVNSGFRRIYVLTQYKSQSLNEHLASGWGVAAAGLDEFIYPVPPQQLKENLWYEGTADALFQNLIHLRAHNPKYVMVLSGDHVYKMDYSAVLAAHIKHEADLTVSVMPFERAASSGFGIVDMAPDGRIAGFIEKPKDPPPMPGRPDLSLVNMGVYVFRASTLFSWLEADATKRGSSHDFGKDIIPAMLGRTEMYAHPFHGPDGGTPYWRDIGTLESYYDANMDLLSVTPQFNLYDSEWPIRVRALPLPPMKTVAPGPGENGSLVSSIACGGVIVSGAHVHHSILSPNTTIERGAEVHDSLLFDHVKVGAGAVVRRAIVDKDVTIPPGAHVGVDANLDRSRGFTVTSSGLTVIPKGAVFP